MPRSGRGLASVLAHLEALRTPAAQPSELLVATAEGRDEALDKVLPSLLALVRRQLAMDVVFVSEFRDGQRVFRNVEVPADQPVIAQGGADPLEASWCARVVDGRLPEVMPDASRWLAQGAMDAPGFPIGTHLSVPIVLVNGSVYGTVCCFSFRVSQRLLEQDHEALCRVAALLGEALSPQAPPA